MLRKATARRVRDVINPVGVRAITATKTNERHRQRCITEKKQWQV